jgi:uncharacterized protein
MSDAEENRRVMTAVMDAMALGDGKPFVDAMAEDFAWRMTGTTAWSGVYSGKAEVRGRLLKTLFGQFSSPYRNTASRIIVDQDTVVVECRGEVTTKSGKPYNNSYCWVISMREGKMAELVEYFDTELVTSALEAPDWGCPR